MKKAFTLIEVLVAVFLLGLLFSFLMLSFKMYIDRLKNFSITLPYKAISNEYLDRSIGGYFPYVNNNFKYFLNYKNNSLTYITTSPLYYNSISVAKIICKNNKLLYLESPLYYKTQNYLQPKIIEKHIKIVLLNNLQKCKIIAKTKDSFLNEVVLNINNTKWIFTPNSSWKELKKILYNKANLI